MQNDEHYNTVLPKHKTGAMLWDGKVATMAADSPCDEIAAGSMQDVEHRAGRPVEPFATLRISNQRTIKFRERKGCQVLRFLAFDPHGIS